MTSDSQALARRNIYVLTAAQAPGAASPPIIISLGGLSVSSSRLIRRW